MPTTTSIGLPLIFARSPSTALLNESPSLSIVVMSLNRMPGFGKSGMSRMRAPRSLGAMVAATGERLAEDSAVRSGFLTVEEIRTLAAEPSKHLTQGRCGEAVERRWLETTCADSDLR